MQYKGKGGIQYNLESSPFAQGGEGKVFNIIGKPNMVAKLYKNGLNDVSKERKLLVMVNNPPSKAVMSQIAWPLDVLYDGSNTFVGFVMPKLAINEDLNVIYEYGTSSKYPNVPWSNKIIIAKNLCAVLDAVHEAGHVVGDLNPKNISVDPKTGHIVFVDTDSYHIEDNGSVYRCNVGMPEYLPVEIQKKMKGGLTAAPLPTFTKETDNFALAIHIFQLLMNGTHPFSCRVLPSQASVVFPQPSDNIMNGDFPFINPRSGTSIPVFAPPLSILPKEMQELFKRAFVVGHTNPKQRPTPEDWYNALTNLERQLKKCGRVSHHEYYSGLSQCPWCTADQNFTQGVATAKKTPMVQSTFSKGMAPAYVTPPPPPPTPTWRYGGTSWSAPRTYNTNLGSKFFAIFLPILAFLIGQIVQYIVYDKNGTVLLFDLIFPRVPKAVLIVSTILGIVSIVHISVRSWKLADEDEIVFSWIYNGTASICFAVCPCISGYIGIILTSAISYCLNNYEEERLPYFFTLTACVLGCAITFSQNYNSDKVIILTKLIILTENFDFNVTAFLIITSIINIIAAIILSIASAKLSNAKELFAILLPFCILTIIVPTICAFLLLAYAITIIIIVNKTNSAMIISGIFYSAIIVITIVLGIIGVATAANSNVIEGYNIEKISSFSDISSMANQEVIAIDISGIENKTGKIDTDLDCNVLIIVGKRDDFYSLTINTNATKVIFKNLNISYGCARFTNEIVNVKLIGANSIVGKNGNSGSGWGGSGKNGESAIYAKRITFSGNGSIVLTGGNGGSGSTGLYGSDAGLFGNGGNGGRGGNGGNSGYVISCIVANVEDFSGLITLINGKAGSGGSGGRGGSGGFFGSNGSNGSSGYSGSISGYCTGVVDIPNEYIIKK